MTTEPALNKKSAVDADLHVGRRIRTRRIMLGLTQHDLAAAIGVTYQQAHKYEKGINRISAGRLLEIARALGCSVDFFFEGLQSPSAGDETGRRRLSLEIAKHFSSIDEDRHREAFCHLTRALIDA